MQDIDLTSPWFAAALSNGTRFEVLQMNTELDHALIVSHTGECLATGTSEEIHALAARIEDARTILELLRVDTSKW